MFFYRWDGYGLRATEEAHAEVFLEHVGAKKHNFRLIVVRNRGAKIACMNHHLSKDKITNGRMHQDASCRGLSTHRCVSERSQAMT